MLDEQVAEIADNLRFHRAKSHQEKVRTHTSFRYQASTWTHPRKVVARLECSLQPDLGGTTTNGMRQEVDIRYVVTSLKGGDFSPKSCDEPTGVLCVCFLRLD